MYRRQLKLQTQSNFERWKEKCLKAEPRDRWRIVTRWTRPRTRTYNFTPFDVKNKEEEFWKGVYRVGTAPMCTVETEWD